MINVTSFKNAFAYPPVWVLGAATGGAVAWAGELSGASILAGAVVGILLTVFVSWLISASQHIAELDSELRESRRRELGLRTLLNCAEAIVWRCDNSGQRVYTNQTWTKFTGQSEDDSEKLGWREMIHADDLSHYDTTLRLATLEKSGGNAEYRIRRDSGGWMHVMERFVPVLDEQGEFSGLIGAAVDISDRKRLEADLRQQLEDLQNVLEAINKRSEDLKVHHQRLEQRTAKAVERERTTCEYLAALSGDLRKPCGEIRDAVGVLRQTDLIEQQKLDVERIRNASIKLNAVVERSVELAALDEQAGSGIDIESCDLRELIEQVTDHLGEQASQLGIHLASSIEGSVPAVVKTDPYRLRRVILLLWSGAMQFAKKGALRLNVTTDGKSGATAHLLFSVLLPTKSVTQDALDRAYYPEQSLDSESGGLGLVRCQRIAEQLGGRIGVERDEEGAANFWLKLNVPTVDAGLDGRRAHNRLAQEAIRSSLGLVLDLSKGGMRVQSKKLPEDTVYDVELADDEDTILLRAETAWSNKTGFRRFEIGVKFIDMSSELEARLANLGTRNRVRRVFEAAA